MKITISRNDKEDKELTSSITRLEAQVATMTEKMNRIEQAYIEIFNDYQKKIVMLEKFRTDYLDVGIMRELKGEVNKMASTFGDTEAHAGAVEIDTILPNGDLIRKGQSKPSEKLE